ncbi:MAG: hypothetical protein NZ576_08935 [Bacteroidia bacterium]|nr:hypothetical protein [Bacteroidia bacterium]
MKYTPPLGWKLPISKGKNISLIGIKCDYLLCLDLNTFYRECILPGLFLLAEYEGKRYSKSDKEAGINQTLDSLCQTEPMQAWQNHKDLLLEWLQQSIFKVGKAGLNRQKDKILFFYPLTYSSYRKAELKSNLIRDIPHFLYQLLTNYIQAKYKSDSNTISRVLPNIFRRIFQYEEIDFNLKSSSNSTRPGVSKHPHNRKLDLEAWLSDLIHSQFEEPEPGRYNISVHPPILKNCAYRLAQNIFYFSAFFQKYLTPQELIKRLTTLICFEIYIYVLNYIQGLRHLYYNKQFPDCFKSTSDATVCTQFYVDCSKGNNFYSRQLARLCLGEHLSQLPDFIYHQIYFRTIDAIIQHLNYENPERVKGWYSLREDPVKYFETIHQAFINYENDKQANSPTIQAIEEIAREKIKDLVEQLKEEEEPDADLIHLDNITRNNPTQVKRLVQILFEKQKSKAQSNIEQWWKEAAGILSVNEGIASGTARRNTWAYDLSDELLWILVHLFAIQGSAKPQRFLNLKAEKIRLVDFLQKLEKEYGILIDKVPVQYQGFYEYEQAAEQNRRALQVRLSQMGFFRNYADDFQAQFIQLYF